MIPASSKTQIIWLEDRIVSLEKRLDEVERLNKAIPPVTTRKLSRQWGWTLIPKPLTDEQIYECYRTEFDILLTDSGAQNTIKRFAKAVERAHGRKEK